MGEKYTTSLKRQTNELSDFYFISCASSSEGEKKEFPLAGTVAKLALVTTLSTGVADYTVQAKDMIVASQNIPVMTAAAVQQNGKMTSERFGNITLEVSPAPNYQAKPRRTLNAEIDRFACVKRIQMLMDSYQKNKVAETAPYSSLWTMRVANSALCKLPFIDSILQYDKYDDVWQYNLFFDHDLELSVSVYVEDDAINDVDYSVYHQGELVVSNALPLLQVVRKMKTVISRVEKNA